ncbi:RHS repeat domain-containing protein [Tenacibaculum maritimum]|uniref:RHS repeat domain-containing protein n=3 Tax=Tenacibaculum maritimum TaxID=107401 RepID=UPI00132F69B6|nr:RHS repeat-associated core domain-containing protein [Tenacibaculum maritimum]
MDLNGRVRSIVGKDGFCNIRFQGQVYDDDIQLCYNRFRWYDDVDGRYISKDPIGLLSGEYGFYNYVGDSNGWVDPFGLMELFRSMSRSEYFDIKKNGWNGRENMGSKWFAESYDDAVKWGHTMGHGDDSKFYVVKFDVDDTVADKAYKVKGLDGIGNARAIDVEDLNGNTKMKKVNSHRVGYNK